METKALDELGALGGERDESRCGIDTTGHGLHVGVPHQTQISGFNSPIEEYAEIRHPWVACSVASLKEHQQHVNLKLRELVVGSPKIELIEGQALCVDLSPVGATVAVWAEGDQVFVIVGSNFCPRDNVMNVNFDLATGRNGTAVPGFDFYPTL